jgi:predicted GTPase
VVSLVCGVRADVSCPTATNYLLQHAAGSGKSLTIAALAAILLDTVSPTPLSSDADSSEKHWSWL